MAEHMKFPPTDHPHEWKRDLQPEATAHVAPGTEMATAYDVKGLHRRFQEFECRTQTLKKLFPWDFRELRFRIVQIVDVHAFDIQIFQAAPKLVLQEFGGHAMAAGSKIFGAKNPSLGVFAKKILVRIGGH